MKKLFYFIAFMAFSTIMLCSCSDNDPEQTPDKDETVDYLLMHYSVGGGNLDYNIVANLMQILNEGSNKKVKMTFQFKLSNTMQKYDVLKNFNGTRRFTADDNAELKGQFSEILANNTVLSPDNLIDFSNRLKSEKIGDAQYNMSCSEGLSDFIRWSKAKYPNAKRVILVLSDHGGAWSLNKDGKNDTRAIIFDDNRTEDDGTGESLSLHDVVDGVKKGGAIDVLYADACLMSTFENLYGYAQCVKYLLASFEIAPGCGGEFSVLTKLLKNSGTDDASLEATLKSYIDYCTSAAWWETKSPYCHDLGLFDLSRLSEVTTVLKRVSDTLAEKYANDEPLQLPEEVKDEDVPLGRTMAPYIRQAMTSCIVSYTSHYIPAERLPGVIVQYLLADGIQLKGTDFFSFDVLRWIRYAYTDKAKEAYENYPKEWNDTKWELASLNYTSFSMTHLLYNIAYSLYEVKALNNPFEQLYDDLIDAIKSVAYIKCTKSPDVMNLDTAYEYCSPGVVLLPLNELYELSSGMNTFLPVITTHEEALRYYQSTEFDQQVGWSRVLQCLDVFPSAFSNPMRDARGLLGPWAPNTDGGDNN